MPEKLDSLGNPLRNSSTSSGPASVYAAPYDLGPYSSLVAACCEAGQRFHMNRMIIYYQTSADNILQLKADAHHSDLAHKKLEVRPRAGTAVSVCYGRSTVR